jgi:prepilin-type N-terminal cleavage/methylation domain-containing protein
MKKLFDLREKLASKLEKASGLQKGFTLMEMLAVVFIIIILLALIVIGFSFFGRVDGTELTAESKNVESAVLQVALGNENRDIPAEYLTGDTKATGATEVTRGKQSELNSTRVELDVDAVFENPTDASKVLTAVAAGVGLDQDRLLGLLRPVLDAKVQKSISGQAKAEEYFVVVKKSQLYDLSVTSLDTDYSDYNDELAGQVFSFKTVIDSDGVHYNGTHVIR